MGPLPQGVITRPSNPARKARLSPVRRTAAPTGGIHAERGTGDLVDRRGSAALWPRRYDLLDGWRGLAALVVVCHHVTNVKLGHWAVLVFFVISGYCISASADSCVEKGVGFAGFMKRRLRRIYPPYLLALAFFLATRLAKVLLHGDNDLARFSPLQVLQNVTLMQWWTLLAHPQPHAFGNPTLMVTAFWSLDYEEQFYLLVALMLLVSSIWPRIRMAYLLISITALSLAWAVLFGRLSYGLFLDYWPVFGLGSLAYARLCVFRSAGARQAVDASLLGLALVSAAVTGHHPCDREAGLLYGHGRAVAAEVLVGSCFALFLIGTRGMNDWVARTPLGAPLRFLGLVSYSLYLVHQFNLTAVQTAVRAILGGESPRLVWTLLTLSLHVALAAVFWYLCERPFLNQPLGRPQTRRPSGEPAVRAS